MNKIEVYLKNGEIETLTKNNEVVNDADLKDSIYRDATRYGEIMSDKREVDSTGSHYRKTRFILKK